MTEEQFEKIFKMTDKDSRARAIDGSPPCKIRIYNITFVKIVTFRKEILQFHKYNIDIC